MSSTPTRRRRPNLSEQVQILARQARCALSGEKFDGVKDIEWDHAVERHLGGPDSVENWQAVKKVAHKIKTNGTKATSAGSSKHKAAKVRRLVKARKPKAPSRIWPSRKIPSRGFEKRREARQ